MGVGQASSPLKCFFHFEIPQYLNCELLGENPGGYLRDLPASFSCVERPNRRAVLQDRCEGDCHISYKVLVRALHHREVIASCTQHVKLVPSSESRPPVCVADFPNEYALAKSRCIRTGFLGMHRSGEWRLEAGEPVSLILSQVTDRVFLPVSLTLTQTVRSRRACHDDEPGNVAIGLCAGALISSTFISSVPRQSVPTLREVSNSTSLGRKTNVCAKTKISVQFSKWREAALTLRGWEIQMHPLSNVHPTDKFNRRRLLLRSHQTMALQRCRDPRVPQRRVLGPHLRIFLGLAAVQTAAQRPYREAASIQFPSHSTRADILPERQSPPQRPLEFIPRGRIASVRFIASSGIGFGPWLYFTTPCVNFNSLRTVRTLMKIPPYTMR